MSQSLPLFPHLQHNPPIYRNLDTETMPPLHLFKIRHWPIWLLISLLWLLNQLPYRWQLGLGKHLGQLLMWVDKKSRQNTLVNLQLCFPELDEQQRQQRCRDNFASLGCALLESSMAWWGSDKRLRKLAHFHGLHHLQQAAAQQQSIILLSAHFHGLELVGRLITLEFPFCVTYRPQKNAVLDYLARHYRHKHYLKIIERNDIRSMIKTLKQDGVVFYAADTDVGHKGPFVPFFNIPASTTTATSRYAKRTQAQVIPVFFNRRDNASGYDIHLQAPLKNFPSHDIIQDTLRTNQCIEQAIQRHPTQYLWQYRRFKSRPQQAPCFYDKTPV